ncbi:MAG: tRNA A-37 threonylcarbamoyl transferase component Bud32 [Arenicella sp.]|jgi:tRNA A-37 threonylcarbamoyl transferase component Bud32
MLLGNSRVFVERIDWAKRPVTRSIDWNSRTWVLSEYLGLLPKNAKLLNQLLLDTDAAFKHDRTTTVSRVELAGELMVLKRYNPRNQWHKIKRALRRSRARRCWQMSYAFSEAGLNVAAPILMLEDRFGPFRLNAYFVNEFLEGQELMTLLPSMDDAQQLKVAEAINDAFEKLKAARLTHGDLKASNLMWSNDRLYFIDLDAAQQHRNSVTWLKGHNKDRKRFLKNWQGDSRLLAIFNR